VRIPLDGLLANGELVEAEGRPITDAGRVAFLRDLSYTGDGTLVFGLLLPGAGPLIATITPPATTAGAARTQAVRQARLRVLLPPRGSLPGPGELVDALPPLLALGPHRLLFFAGLSRADLNEEGLFAIDPSQPADPIPAEAVAVTRLTAPSGGVYDGFSDTAEYLLNPPSVFSDGQGENVVFRSRLRGAAGGFGVFQWTGSGAPTAVRLSADPNQVRRWEAGRSRLVYLLAQETSGRSSLLRRPAPGAPLEPLPAAAALTAIEDFVLTRDGSLFAFGADATGPGLFRVDRAAPERVPGVRQGVPLPAFADGTPARGAFDLLPAAGETGSRVELQRDSRRGVLHFTVGVLANGSRLKGLFRYDPARGRVETLAVESLEATSRNNVTVTTLNSLGEFRQTSAAWTAYAVQQGGRWQIARARTITDRSGTRIDNEVIVREGLRLSDGQTLQTLDAHALLRAQGRTDRQGPVFALSDTGDVAFWASDGTTWGLYQVRAPGP
jgi:hypothetical protein